MMTIKDLLLDKLDCRPCRKAYWKLESLYYSIKNYFFPRQRWLLDVVPDHYSDIDHLIEIILTKCLIQFVEVELKWTNFNEEDYKDFPEHQLIFYKELWTNYLRIKKELPALRLEEEAEWNRVEQVRDKLGPNASYQEIYGKVSILEEKIKDLQTSVFNWMILNRESMWT